MGGRGGGGGGGGSEAGEEEADGGKSGDGDAVPVAAAVGADDVSERRATDGAAIEGANRRSRGDVPPRVPGDALRREVARRGGGMASTDVKRTPEE